jgi:hypothetical protein
MISGISGYSGLNFSLNVKSVYSTPEGAIPKSPIQILMEVMDERREIREAMIERFQKAKALREGDAAAWQRGELVYMPVEDFMLPPRPSVDTTA